MARARKSGQIRKLLKNDVFGKLYDVIRNNFPKGKAAEQQRKQKERPAKIVENLPRGKLIHFKSARYLFEVVDLDFDNAEISFRSAEGNTLEIIEAKIQLRDLAIDPELGGRLGSFVVSAALAKDKAKLGGVYVKGVSRRVKDSCLNLIYGSKS